MKYVAIYDRHGSIVSLIAGPPDGPPMVIALEAGQQATEVDLAESGLDFTTIETERAALEALARMRVEVKGGEARLVRRRVESG